ncbi:ATP-binding cassette domain-containing protein [Tsukamurella sp. 8F]|uniref:ABC transporter ATP-binding protein n=1 Tax=unclassified Tsukamurella TaxID=2633480 RepID=UPI0023B9EB01|nr:MULTISPECIES: ATP-binding cassette domain-containing protein [unclassified Tsukamurella]MDF0528741.1 ATP-binding cassette domain-containing protein [Tsukamurella sp. 8J]MDF0589133.1 ATP-binding cassette domain-containing protein [Tsukamurella sp. 8F]
MSARIRGLTVTVGERELVRDIDFDVEPGRVTVLTGPSGAGKSTVAAALAGALPEGARVAGDLDIPPGTRVGYVPQDGALTLNPGRRVGTALHGYAALGGRRDGGQARVRAALEAVGFEAGELPRRALRRFPHGFSGGQRSRLAVAQVLVTRPDLLILDEPSSGLDGAARDRLAGGIAALAGDGVAVLLVTHDAALAAHGDELLYLRKGRLAPPAPRTDAVVTPRGTRGDLLRLDRVRVRIDLDLLTEPFDLAVGAGELVGLVGPSGAGKSTLARAVAGLAPVAAGRVLVDGVALGSLRARSRTQTAAVQYVPQEIRASFDAHRTVLTQVGATARWLRGLGREAADAEAEALLAELGLEQATIARHPGGLSGGELRRAALARCLLARPRMLVCDETTTGLDALAASRVHELLDGYRAESGAGVLLISHHEADLARVDRIVPVRDGRTSLGADGVGGAC